MLQNKKIIILSVLLLIIIVAVVLFLFRNDSTPNNQDSGDINYNPPTEQELEETEQHKEEIANKNQEYDPAQPSDTENSNGKKDIKPVVTFWGQASAGKDFELNGYVPGVIEEDGICTVILSKSSEEVTESKKALPDAQSTSCGLITIPRGQLSAGEWTVKLRYESSESAGISSPEKVSIK